MVRKKIAFIGVKGLPAHGGSARAGENLIAMLNYKYDFTVYTTASHTSRISGYYDGYKQIVFTKFPISSLNTLVYYVKSVFHCLFLSKYEVVMVYHLDAAFIIPILKLKYKVLASVRARPQFYSKWNWFAQKYFQLMEKIFLKMPAHTITSISKIIIDEYKPLISKEIVYTPNGILFSDIKKDYPQIRYSGYVLFTAGRIMESKGCHVLLKAMKKINYKDKILVIGNLLHDVQYAKYLKELAADLNVEFIDIIKEKDVLMSFIKNAKLTVYPSFIEGMSNMLLEIAAMKSPLICSDIPENIVVFDNHEVLLFKSENSDDLASKIEWALSNYNEMTNRAEMAFNKVKSVYNWELIAPQYDRLFSELIQTI